REGTGGEFRGEVPVAEWTASLRALGGARVDLPTYPFQNQHYWIEEPSAPAQDRPGEETEAEAEAGAEAGARTGKDDGAAGLTAMAPAERDRALTTIVRRETAQVFGYESGEDVDLADGFEELGIDSLTAVELRNRLTGATGLRLPPTLLFDCPTPLALIDRLREEIGTGPAEAGAEALAPVHAELDRLESALATAAASAATGDGAGEAARIAERLRSMLLDWNDRAALADPGATASGDPSADLSGASAQEVFDLLDAELETP
ncbi:phosphopantetheine-binding protein, partial [Streptomyces sp. DH37]|uniref:phosphopantetheine-binding protein n=1 Tax=Streptomyces sp. DH37 TaxID=3040122 RepID=UPI0024420534